MKQIKPPYSLWERTCIKLTCGHKPTEIHFDENQGYCSKCNKWLLIDHDASWADVREARKQIDKPPVWDRHLK